MTGNNIMTDYPMTCELSAIASEQPTTHKGVGEVRGTSAKAEAVSRFSGEHANIQPKKTLRSNFDVQMRT
jgi:hypothetical protein